MLGDRDIKGLIDRAIDKLYDGLTNNIDKNNSDRIHALEASRCTRLSYYERKEPLPMDKSTKMTDMLRNAIRNSLNSDNNLGEYKVENLTLEVTSDMILNNEFVVIFEIVRDLPEIPHPRELLYLNACLFAFNKIEGLIIYMTTEGKTLEFSVTKNNKMFEEIIRRARVLSTLLKENRVPIVEPSEFCLRCKYYERCYSTEKKSSNFSIESLMGLGKKGN
jgi:CRISPR-associated exonuclease Cas4